MAEQPVRRNILLTPVQFANDKQNMWVFPRERTATEIRLTVVNRQQQPYEGVSSDWYTVGATIQIGNETWRLVELSDQTKVDNPTDVIAILESDTGEQYPLAKSTSLF